MNTTLTPRRLPRTISPRPRRIRLFLSALLGVVMLAAACSDVDVPGQMAVISEGRDARESQAAADAEAALAAEATAAEIEAEVLAQAEADAIATAEAEATEATATANEATTTPEDENEPTDGDPEATPDPDDEEPDEPEDDHPEWPGEPASVTEGFWTVSQEDLGVRIRSVPAGDILGFIVRGDVVSTTGSGRILNNVSWGEVEMQDGVTGWIALDLLEAVEKPAGNGSTLREIEPDEVNTDDLTAITVQPQAAFVSARSATLTVYAEPRTTSTALLTLKPGDQLQIISADGWRNGEARFVFVSFEGTEGWLDGRFVDVQS